VLIDWWVSQRVSRVRYGRASRRTTTGWQDDVCNQVHVWKPTHNNSCLCAAVRRSDSPRPSHHLTSPPLHRAPISDKESYVAPAFGGRRHHLSSTHAHSFAASASDTTFFAYTLPLTTLSPPTRIPQRCLACTSITPRTLPFPSSHSPLCAPSPYHRRIQRLPHPEKHITSSLSQYAQEEGARQSEQEGEGTEWSCRWEASVDEEVCQKL
jgi:hypothetical protein